MAKPKKVTKSDAEIIVEVAPDAPDALDAPEPTVVEYVFPKGVVFESISYDGQYVNYSLLDGTSYKKHLSELPKK